MTAYHGGKQRIGKEIAEVIYEISIELEEDGEMDIIGYCEPFVGMGGVYQHIPEMFKGHKPKLKYKAGDVNKSVIMMWKAAQKGWIPPIKITKTSYEKLKKKKGSSPEKGYVGHQYGFCGQYFGTYNGRMANAGKKNVSTKVCRIAKTLKSVTFTPGDYTRYGNLKNYVIYCDPPYANHMQKYFTEDRHPRGKFDHKAFWEWCYKMSEDNLVFVSEYSASRVYADKVYSVKDRKKLEGGNENLYLVK